jgi:hypothetical protein
MNAFALAFENFLVARAEVEVGTLTERSGALRGEGRCLSQAFALELSGESRRCLLHFEQGALSMPVIRSIVDALFVEITTLETVEVKLPGQAPRIFTPATFYQTPDPWHHQGDRYPAPHIPGATGDIRHPEREEPRATILYRRHCAGIDRTLSLKTFDVEEHMELFVGWMNDPEVANFWEMAWEPARLREYVEERIRDRHVVPIIGYFDDIPFGYFEAYWAKEDRLGPHYEAHDYDRGFHMAVGDARFRFQGFGRHWFLGMAHFLFLDDPRTMRLVGEPRVDQARVRGWAKSTPWEIVKEIQFPHKRAVLMMMSREAFFGSYRI